MDLIKEENKISNMKSLFFPKNPNTNQDMDCIWKANNNHHNNKNPDSKLNLDNRELDGCEIVNMMEDFLEYSCPKYDNNHTILMESHNNNNDCDQYHKWIKINGNNIKSLQINHFDNQRYFHKKILQ